MSISSSVVLATDTVDEGYEINPEVAAGPGIEMIEREGYKGLFAKQAFVEDAVIFYLKGRVSTRPTKYSIQLDSDKHLDFPLVRKQNDDLDYSWQFLNHSCDPNGYMNIAEYAFRALRNISKGEEITFNYLTTESELATPFNCNCGAAGCLGVIRGNKHQASIQPALREP